MELFKHIIHSDLHWIIANYSGTFYFILFAIIFIETGLVVMPFLPGDSLLFMAGLVARAGDLDIMSVISLLFIAAVMGDNLNYFVGRKIGLRVARGKYKGKYIVNQAYLEKTHSFFDKYGPKTIIMARFVPIVRTFSPFVAGIAEMSYPTFLTYDILGGGIWICSMTFAGYLLGNIDIIRDHVDLVAIAIVLLSVTPIIIGVIKNKKTK